MATDVVAKRFESDSDAKGFSITRSKAPYYSDGDSKLYRKTRKFWLRWQAYIVECGEIVTPKNIVHCIQPVVLTEVMFWTDKDFLDPCDELTNVSQSGKGRSLDPGSNDTELRGGGCMARRDIEGDQGSASI